jgi:L-ascorbate metabolism protein UlaG (beta-lactamase superfamily)
VKVETSTDRLAGGHLAMMLLRAQVYDGSFILWWLGQSGFAIRYRDEMVAVDPYLSDSLTRKYAGTDKPHVRIHPIVIEPNWLAQSLLTVVTASHQHTDHLDPETLRPIMDRVPQMGVEVPLVAPKAWCLLAAERAGVELASIVGMDDGATAQVRSFSFEGIPSAHDKIERDEAGHHKYLGYVIRFGDWTVYHSGDTVVYPGLADRLRRFGVDVALLPINGKVGNMNGAEAARLAHDIGAKLVVPCHYDMFEFNTASPYELFVPECERLGQPYKVLQAGERLTLTK